MTRESSRTAILEWDDQVLRLSTIENDADEEHHLTDLVGWYGGVGVHGDEPQRELGHGLFGRPAVRTGRTLTLKGSLFYRLEKWRDIADRYVSGILGSGEYGRLTYQVDGLETFADVRLDGEVKHTTKGHQWIDFEVPLTAADPFIYGTLNTTQITPPGYGVAARYGPGLFAGGAALRYYGGPPPGGVIRNNGNAPAWPVVVVRGSWPAGFRITSSGGVIEYPHPVWEQTPLTINTQEGSVMIGGQDHTHLATRREWFSIPKRGIVTVKIDQRAPSEGWADVYARDTYI